MSIQLSVFLVLLVTTIYVNAIQWYTQVETYPLNAFVGPREYKAYGAFYEKRLTYALYIPYFIMLLSNFYLLFNHPSQLDIGWLLVELVANVSIAVISFTLAVPLHKQSSMNNAVNDDTMRKLLHVNSLRLSAATLSSVITLMFLGRMLIG